MPDYNLVAVRKQPHCYKNNYNTVGMNNFGDWVRDHRKRLGLYQSDLAKRAGVSTSYISTIERGQRHSITGAELRPEPQKVTAIAKALGQSADEALLLTGYAPKTETPTFNLAESARLALLDQNLTPEEQAEIVEEMAIAYEIVMARRKARSAKALNTE